MKDKKFIAICGRMGFHYKWTMFLGLLITAIGLLCIPFGEDSWVMPIGHLLSLNPHVAVGILLMLAGLAMPKLALQCKYLKQKITYIILDVIVVADGVFSIFNLVSVNLIFSIAFMIMSVELFGYAFFKNPEEPKAAFNILEAGITAIILLIVVICNICGLFTFNHPIALPRTLGILIMILGVGIIAIGFLFRLPKGSEARRAYMIEHFVDKDEKEPKPEGAETETGK